MKACKYCGREFPNNRGLNLHTIRVHQKEVAAKKYFEEEGRRIEAQVHQMIEAKKRELVVKQRAEQLHNELQSLANDIENEWKPLTICHLCGGSWDNHKEECLFKQTRSTLNEFLDFMTILLGSR